MRSIKGAVTLYWRCLCLNISRRDFIKGATAIIGGLITAVIGIPTIAYLIDPALQESDRGGLDSHRETGGDAGRHANSLLVHASSRSTAGNGPPPATGDMSSANRRTPDDLLILNSRCTHLACTVNWSENDKVYLCPCHDAKFSEQGLVLDGPPPRPLDRYTEFRVTEDGILEIHYQA